MPIKLTAFILSLALAIALPLFAPSFRLNTLAPFMVWICWRSPHQVALFWALVCGLSWDLLSSYQHLGLFALNYCLTTTLIYRQKRNFFSDSLSTIPILTFLFSLTSTMLQALFTFIFEKGMIISWDWAVTDLLLMPLLDGAYAFVVFALAANASLRNKQAGHF